MKPVAQRGRPTYFPSAKDEEKKKLADALVSAETEVRKLYDRAYEFFKKDNKQHKSLIMAILNTISEFETLTNQLCELQTELQRAEELGEMVHTCRNCKACNAGN